LRGRDFEMERGRKGDGAKGRRLSEVSDFERERLRE